MSGKKHVSGKQISALVGGLVSAQGEFEILSQRDIQWGVENPELFAQLCAEALRTRLGDNLPVFSLRQRPDVFFVPRMIFTLSGLTFIIMSVGDLVYACTGRKGGAGKAIAVRYVFNEKSLKEMSDKRFAGQVIEMCEDGDGSLFCNEYRDMPLHEGIFVSKAHNGVGSECLSYGLPERIVFGIDGAFIFYSGLRSWEDTLPYSALCLFRLRQLDADGK